MAGYADIINKKKKDWNCVGLMDGASAKRGVKLPLSSPLMNWSLYGGIPRGAMSEFFGEPNGGKSTTAIDVCKNAIEVFQNEYDDEIEALREKFANGNKSADAQIAELQDRGPKKVLYIDLEHSFDEAWSKTLGIDNSVLEMMQPPDVIAEDILQMVLDLIETGEMGVIVIDSLPSLVPKAEFEKKLGERTVAALANLLTIFCRKVVPLLSRYETTLLWINQTRDNQDNPYVVQTPGGRAVKFYSLLRIYFRIGTPVDFLGNELPASTENPAGHKIVAKVMKQKSAPWDRKLATYFLMCKSGLRADFDYAQLAVNKYGIIKKTGAWFGMCDPETGEVLEDADKKPIKLNGMAKVYTYLAENPEYYAKLRTFIMDDISGKSSEDLDIVAGVTNG